MRNVLVAVVVAIALGAGALYLNRSAAPSSSRPAVSGVVNAPDTPTINPAPYLEAFPLTPLDAPRFTGNTAANRGLERALGPYRQGDYRAAAIALDGLHLDYPDDPRITLYLGVVRLLTDEPQNALEILRGMPGTASEGLAGEAAWYSLVGAARLRDPSGVQAEARSLCASTLPSAARACAALEVLAKARSRRP
jgi:hypothetical protein